MARFSELMKTNKEREMLALLSCINYDGEWEFDRDGSIFVYANDDDSEGCIGTYWWIEESEDGSAWLWFHDVMEDGYTKLGAGTYGIIGHYEANGDLVV